MRRLNVRLAQIDQCIRSSMFALSVRPTNPELEPGELLLLQLVKQEATLHEKLRSRIDFALVFDRLERDYNGTISRQYWPNEGRTWNWIVYGNMTVPTIPFSLENLQLSRRYDGQDNARRIDPIDEARILPFIQWSLAEQPHPELQIVPPATVSDTFQRAEILAALRNHDRIVETRQRAHVGLAEEAPLYSTNDGSEDSFIRFLTEETRYRRNPALADTLKSYYHYRCQVCGHDFEPRYGQSLAEGHHIQYLSAGGPDVSPNIIVLCPNHHRIIHATNARFDSQNLAYHYPNGLRERLILPDHLEPTGRHIRPAS
ncbi:MAG: HNH endonuclease [Thermomicrobiales bacterium]|nr:HNH endonuclease [Thermomicrobiales bacterium]